MQVQIDDLKNVARVIMGGKSYSGIGNDPPCYVFIEPDGEMEGLDNLRAWRMWWLFGNPCRVIRHL
jgi:hypothetical protein